MKIGIIRESSKPNDKRAPITPSHIKKILQSDKSISFWVQPSEIRIFNNDQYRKAGAEITDDLSMCNYIFGVKEILPECLIPGKHYFFFAHIGKGQAYHKHYTSQLISKQITLTDYEYLVDNSHKRIAAFGKWAGMVGIYYALMAYGKRIQSFDLQSPLEFSEHRQLIQTIKSISFPNVKMIITGNGNAAKGALQLLKKLNIKKISPQQFINSTEGPVFTQLHSQHYNFRKDRKPYNRDDFYSNPKDYYSVFPKFMEKCNLFIPCHYWDPSSPYLFTINDLQQMKSYPTVIADVSCDLNGPIPTTIRATSHREPFYDFNIESRVETKAFSSSKNITVMSVDNLPAALPKESSEFFSFQICNIVINELKRISTSQLIKNATIIEKGTLTNPFVYLKK